MNFIDSDSLRGLAVCNLASHWSYDTTYGVYCWKREGPAGFHGQHYRTFLGDIDESTFDHDIGTSGRQSLSIRKRAREEIYFIGFSTHPVNIVIKKFHQSSLENLMTLLSTMTL